MSFVGCSKMPAFSPARPWRAKTRLVPSNAAVSEGPEVYARTTLAGFFNTSYSALMLEPGDFILKI
jgi:hypothetical protein